MTEAVGRTYPSRCRALDKQVLTPVVISVLSVNSSADKPTQCDVRFTLNLFSEHLLNLHIFVCFVLLPILSLFYDLHSFVILLSLLSSSICASHFCNKTLVGPENFFIPYTLLIFEIKSNPEFNNKSFTGQDHFLHTTSQPTITH